ncbi:MmgE/PrpD family protein [Chloroflexota bacterium]
MDNLSSKYADYICRTTYEDLPLKVVKQAKQQLLDLIGVSLAGYALLDFPRAMVEYLSGLGGSQEATIFTTKSKFPAINAALANGICAHALEMDDGQRIAALHPGAVVIPAAIAAAEITRVDTKELIAGIVVGYEIMVRIGMAINPSSLQRGFHTTGTVGVLGAAAASASILKLTSQQVIGAIGLAGIHGAGILQVNHDNYGSQVKPLTAGKAAMSGLLSAILALKGYSGPLNILEGEDGFFSAMADEVHEASLTVGLGETYEINNVYNKLYVGCRHAHASMDAVKSILEKYQLDHNCIDRILVKTYSAAIRLAGIPNPDTPSAARFSIPFSVALLLKEKEAGADKYTVEQVSNEEILNLVKKVELSVDEGWERLYPDKRGATLIIIDNKGKEYSAQVELAKGEPENPASEQEIYDKFIANATLLMSSTEAKVLADTIMQMEDIPLDKLTRLF